MLQIENRNNLDLDEDTYLTIISRKTASLTAACCLLGAKMSNASETLVRQAEVFGRSLGIAFQIQDDILDIIGDARDVGKTLGIDIEKVKLTLPIIHFLRTAPHEHRLLLRSLLESKELDKVEKIRNLILPSHSIRFAREKAEGYVDQARAALKYLPQSEARQVLDTMAEFVIERGV